ncbi:phage integrase family protein [Modicisalibacter xianhensis]|uniref:Phage integrase family protein n=1 Tax=Modicisalibacter xianhensis TaxID=442341 RepID=A0A4R8FIU3_9GAMM|nr:site-specific integrase [Halomonas xianhensis]TDX26036.1 phage integrase family protein [Halomonas xianhensis]
MCIKTVAYLNPRASLDLIDAYLRQGLSMRHFTIVGKDRSSILVGPGGEESLAFRHYRDYLARSRKISTGTLANYLTHVAIFIEFIYASSEIGIEPTSQNLEHIISLYENYLLFADESDDVLVRRIAEFTGRSHGCNSSSLSVIESALLHFLTLSDMLANSQGEDGLFSRYLPHMIQPVSQREAYRIRSVGWLGGLIRGGAKRKKTSQNRLFRATRLSGKTLGLAQKDENYAFPVSKIAELIMAPNLHRDRALYALLAASGIRSHEALQVKFPDVNLSKKTLKIVNPLNYELKGLTERECGALRYKGRSVEQAFLISPWSEIFFHEIEKYLSYESVKGVNHLFIFQILAGPHKGRPMFASDRSERIKQFRKRAEEIGVDLPKGVGLHSLRHAWGTYMLNDYPVTGGKGLQKSLVSQMMGHSSLSSTNVYAKHEEKEVLRIIQEGRDKIYK